MEPYMPTEKPRRPAAGWSIDLAGPFPPDGNCYLAVAVDCMSKWVEAAPLQSKHAFRTAEWFYSDIVARWGKPDWIRTDNGAEWAADFASLVQIMGIRHSKITVGNSKANGQVERTIRTIKDVIRRCSTMGPPHYWTDDLPAALIALRHATSAAHGYPPFPVITGCVPVLPSDITTELTLPSDEWTPEEEEIYVESMVDIV